MGCGSVRDCTVLMCGAALAVYLIVFWYLVCTVFKIVLGKVFQHQVQVLVVSILMYGC